MRNARRAIGITLAVIAYMGVPFWPLVFVIWRAAAAMGGYRTGWAIVLDWAVLPEMVLLLAGWAAMRLVSRSVINAH